MSQDFTTLVGTDTLNASRTLINGSLEALRSDFSGSSFPLTPIVGQRCHRIDNGKIYVCKSTGPAVWWVVADTTKNYISQENGLSALGLGFGVEVSAPVSGSITINLVNAEGNDPSAASPVVIDFRSPTNDNGNVVRRSVTAANSLVLSSGSTFGVPAISTAFHLYLVEFDDAGTLRMGIINCRNGAHIYALAASGIASATAEGGAGGADSAHVFYAGATVTAKAYRVLARLTWESGLATLGTWTQPSKIDLYTPDMKMPGDIVQTAPPVSGAGSSTASSTPVDVTGASTTITPTSAANIIEFNASGRGNVTAGGAGTNSYFAGEMVRNSTIIQSVSIAVVSSSGTNMQSEGGFAYSGFDQPNTTSATVYKLRHYRVSNGTASTNSANLHVREIQG